MKKVLVIGNGGREHAIAKTLAKDAEVHVLPGNDGIAREFQCHPGNPLIVEDIIKVLEKLPDVLVIFGDPMPLTTGVADELRKKGITVFGPDKDHARLESSRTFAKKFMKTYKVQTLDSPPCKTIDDCEQAIQFLPSPFVIKTNGITAENSTTVIPAIEDALQVCQEIFDGKYGKAGKIVMIEEYIQGKEITYSIIFDGENHVLLPSVRKYTNSKESDSGEVTSGMGSYTPVQWESNTMIKKVIEKIIKPTIAGLKKEKISYKGVLSFNVKIDKDYEPFLMNYKIGFCDPETQSLLSSTIMDWYEVMYNCAIGKLNNTNPLTLAAITVDVVSEGYPVNCETGKIIKGLKSIEDDGVDIFFSGVEKDATGELLQTFKGKAFSVTGVSSDPAKARENVYNALAKIGFDNSYFRTDIAVEDAY